MNNKILQAAQNLLRVNNQVTTLEIKNHLRQLYPSEVWNQDTISAVMIQFEQEGKFTYTDNGTFRTYTGASLPQQPALSVVSTTAVSPVKVTTVPAVQRISVKKALELMQNNKGKFFTAWFKKKKGDDRKISCSYINNQDLTQGYVKVRDASLLAKKQPDPVRQINLQTLYKLQIGNQVYNIRR